MSRTQHRTWSSAPTCVGCRCSGRQSRYCDGPPGWREARGCPHPSWWVDPLLGPVARQTGAHSRVRAVRWRRWYMGALLWLERVASRLGMVQSILIRWWTIRFRSHILAWPPSMGKMYYYFIPKKYIFVVFIVVIFTAIWCCYKLAVWFHYKALIFFLIIATTKHFI